MSDTAGTGQPNGAMPRPDYNGRPYGAEKALNELATTPTGGGPGGTTASAPVPAGPPSMDTLEQLLSRHSPGDLTADTEFPDEPGTAGLPSGAGPGPEVMGEQTRPRVARVLDALAAVTNNPVVASLAAEAAARRV